MNTTHTLLRGTDVIGLKVVSLIDGKELHPVNDIIYDPERNKVSALLIDKGGWFSDAQVIAIEDVHSIGKDAVMIASEDVIRSASSMSQRIAHIARDDINLTKTRIITDKGTELGTISDIYFDEQGTVLEFEVSQGMLKGIKSGKKRIHVSDIITIGIDATIVKDEAREALDEQAKSQGMQGIVTSAQTKAGDMLQTVKQKTTQLKDEGEKLGMKAQYKAQEFQQQAEEKYNEKKNDPQVQSAMNNWLQKNDEIMETIEDKAERLKKELKTFWSQTVGAAQNDQDIREATENTKQVARETVNKSKDVLADKVREAKQSARKKTEHLRQTMEKDANDYSYTSYAGMKGGRTEKNDPTTE